MTVFFGKIDDFLASLGSRFWVWSAVLVFLLLYGMINHNNVSGWPSTDVWLRTIDSDVYLRLTKVRELIQGGSLYNHEVIATNAPYGGITTPWTRPLDFILLTLYQMTPSDLSIEKRLLITANWYPLLIVIFMVYFLTKAAETGGRSLQKFSLVVLCLLTDLIFNAHNYFMAGNADHHSLQALLWCISIWLLLGRPSILSATFLSFTMGLWFWISPESLPFIFTVYGILGIKTVLTPTRARYATLASVVLTFVTLLALFVEYPTDEVLSSRAYDSISMVYVILFSFCAVGFMVLQYGIARQPNITTRFIATGISAIILSTIYIGLFPKFLKGPMADVDPYILSSFLPRVSEAVPLFKLDSDIILSSLYLTIPALLLSLRFIKKSPILFVLLIVPFGMNIFQNRWYYYLEISSIVAIAKFLPVYSRALAWKHLNIRLLLHPYLFMGLLCLVVSGISLSLPPSKALPYAYIDKCQFESFQLIQSGALVKALGQKTPFIIESNALGNSGISFFTPYSYIAGYYHREGKGLQIKDAIFDAPTLASARPILKERNVRALFFCPTGYKSWMNDYFNNTSPQLDWIKINKQMQFRKNSGIDTHPILLNIEP